MAGGRIDVAVLLGAAVTVLSALHRLEGHLQRLNSMRFYYAFYRLVCELAVLGDVQRLITHACTINVNTSIKACLS